MLSLVKYIVKDEVVMPADARILTTMAERVYACIWAEVESTSEKVVRTFKIFGNGHEIEIPKSSKLYEKYYYEYVGSCIDDEQNAKFVYERKLK